MFQNYKKESKVLLCIFEKDNEKNSIRISLLCWVNSNHRKCDAFFQGMIP